VEHSIPTSMGDGALVRMTPAEIEAAIRDGVAAAVKCAKVDPLTEDEIAHLLDIFSSRSRFSAVDIGDEVTLSYDGCGSQDIGTRVNNLQYYEQYLCADSVELYHHDYSYKPAKAVFGLEQTTMRQAQFLITAPCGYGAMPDLGPYTVPDGPIANWSQLLPMGKIDEARAAQEEAVELATEIGMASEFVLGMHGELEYDGVRLAGLWPREQMKLAAKAGVTIFGPAINVNTGKPVAWNVARTITIVKQCCEESTVPVPLNGGMGVGGVLMRILPPGDAASRASRSAVDILRLDGL
jgi:dimethylamine--corrinoid protein Co-methyltransferase